MNLAIGSVLRVFRSSRKSNVDKRVHWLAALLFVAMFLGSILYEHTGQNPLRFWGTVSIFAVLAAARFCHLDLAAGKSHRNTVSLSTSR
jgi:hypothetical protein